MYYKMPALYLMAIFKDFQLQSNHIFYIALSSFLPFQMVEIFCSLALNYTFFGEWTKTLSQWGLISSKRFESSNFISLAACCETCGSPLNVLQLIIGLNGGETNCGRHPTDEQLRHVDIFFSNHYNLQSVHFELYKKIDEIIFIQVSRCYQFNSQKPDVLRLRSCRSILLTVCRGSRFRIGVRSVFWNGDLKSKNYWN